MKNKIQTGDALEFLNNSGDDIVSGQIVELASTIAVAAVDISDGKSGTIDVEGVFSLPKLTGEAHVVGDQLHFDPADGKLKKTATALTKYAGMCAANAASAATSVNCKLAIAPISFVAP